MSAPKDDDLEVDEFVAQLEDLTEKIERDIAEGGYSPGAALSALINVTAFQLLYCAEPGDALQHFIADLLELLEALLNMSDGET